VQTQKLIAIAAIVLGLLLATNILSLATVLLDTVAPTIGACIPAGTSGSPTPWTPGQSIQLQAAVSFTSPDTYTSSTVFVSGSWTGGSLASKGMAPYVVGGTYQGYYFYDWTVPSTTGLIMAFTFTAKDSAGNTATKTTYAETGDPTGDFYINGQKVSTSSVITVSSATLTFKITVTNLASYVTDARITITKGSNTATLTKTGGQLTQSGVDYTGSYTLIWGDGSYTITAQIYATSGSKWYTLSILGFDFGTTINPTTLSISQWLGIILTIAGAFVLMRKR
jgi:hypothetical protein